jgi:hypothetical protein
VDGDVIGIAGDLQDGGAAYAGQDPPDLVQRRLGDVGHDVLAPLGRYDAAYGAEDPLYLLPLGGQGLVRSDDGRLGLDYGPDLYQPVHLERGPGGDQVDYVVGDAQVRHDLRRAGHEDDVHVLPLGLEEPLGDVREGCCYPAPVLYVVDAADRGPLGDGHRQPAVSESEVQDVLEVVARLGELVQAGYAHVDGSPRDELGYVLGAHEHDLDVMVPDLDVQLPAYVLPHIEAGLHEELYGPLVQSSFVWHTESQSHMNQRRVS